MSQYLPLFDVLDGAPPPAELDFLEFEHHGVRVRAYGFLHAVTGAPNEAYRAFVARAIDRAPGLRLGEMGLKRAYPALDGELDDFLPVPFRDALAIGFAMTCRPTSAWSILKGLVLEQVRHDDPFGAGRPGGIVDLARSPRFHRIDPWQRRKLAGMPEPEAYLRINLARRRGAPGMRGPVFPDPGWAWLSVIEPRANIPVRSVHMLEYAVERARAAGQGTVSLFVGETHHTDMAWLASGGGATLDAAERAEVERVAEAARRHAHLRATGGGRLAKLRFSGAIALGAAPLFLGMLALGWR